MNTLLENRIYELEQEVARLSVDTVTGLAGRAVFDHTLEREFARTQRTGKPMAVVMLDLDNFKYINDTFGHPIGDLVLRQVAGAIRESSRGSDTLCRYGGDEFVLIMPETTSLGVKKVTEDVHADARVLQINPAGVVTVSIGWSMTDESDTCGANVLKRADDALLSAKRAGRNRVHSLLK